MEATPGFILLCRIDKATILENEADFDAECRADDLIPEESETVLTALKRLPPKEAYDRVFRMRRAFQVRER